MAPPTTIKGRLFASLATHTGDFKRMKLDGLIFRDKLDSLLEDRPGRVAGLTTYNILWGIPDEIGFQRPLN